MILGEGKVGFVREKCGILGDSKPHWNEGKGISLEKRESGKGSGSGRDKRQLLAGNGKNPGNADLGGEFGNLGRSWDRECAGKGKEELQQEQLCGNFAGILGAKTLGMGAGKGFWKCFFPGKDFFFPRKKWIWSWEWIWVISGIFPVCPMGEFWLENPWNVDGVWKQLRVFL